MKRNRIPTFGLSLVRLLTAATTLGMAAALLFPWDSASGAPVSSATAEAAVKGWLANNPSPMGETVGASVSKVREFKDGTTNVIYYDVELSPNGFVIVPADDLVEPIIMFAPLGAYHPSKTNALGALVSQDLPARVARARALSSAGTTTTALNTTPVPSDMLTASNKWQQLVASGSSGASLMNLPSVSDVRIAPLIQTLWSQQSAGDQGTEACYNYYTPPYAAGSLDNYVCGCVATAMAQLMRFYQYPTVGVGTASFSVTVNGTAQNVSLRGGNGAGGPYNWADMPLATSSSTSVAQCQAIGALTADAGATVNMQYTADDSGSYVSVGSTQLVSTFKFTGSICGGNEGNDIGAGLVAMVNPSLDARLPVLFGISGTPGGHCIVGDGYGYNAGTLYTHLNLGWSGVDNAWYNLPTVDTDQGTFTSVGSCVYNTYTNGTGEIISGRVVDGNNSPIAGASVTATRTGGGTYTNITDANGIFALAKIPSASTYSITVAKTGYTASTASFSTGTSTALVATSGDYWGANFTLAPSGSGAPIITTSPQSITVTVGTPASFSVAATGTAPFQYFWQHNSVAIAGASASTYTVSSPQLANSGDQYLCIVSNSVGGATSQPATLTVVPQTSQPRYAIFGADTSTDLNDVKAKIVGTGQLYATNVDIYMVQAPNATPTLSVLQQYTAILVYDASPFTDSTNLGNILANYVDGGGGLVMACDAFSSTNSGIAGRLLTGGYLPLLPGPEDIGQADLTPYQDLPYHALLENVPFGFPDGGPNSYHDDVGLAAAATLVAQWYDGWPMEATVITNSHRVVGLNMFPPSTDANSFGWLSGTYGDQVLVNALLWAGKKNQNLVTNVVVFNDDTHNLSPLPAALAGLGISYQSYNASQEAAFETAVTNASPFSSLVIVDAALNVYSLTAVTAFANAGGLAVLEYVALDNGSPNSANLAAAFEATPEGAYDDTYSVYDWQTTPLFSGLYNSPMQFNEDNSIYAVEAIQLEPTGDAFAAGGFLYSSPVNGYGAVVIGNDYGTIVNGFLWEEITPAVDGVTFAQNEILQQYDEGAVTPAEITTQPQDQVVNVGQSATFSVAAQSFVPLTYSWLQNGHVIGGATDSSYTLANAQLTNTGSQFSCIVSDSAGIATSSNATLTVLPPGQSLVSLDATTTGWYDATGAHDPGNTNYLTGGFNADVYRNFFVFNIPALTGEVASAVLTIKTYDIQTPKPSETYQVGSVSIPVSTLVMGVTNPAVFNALGSGTVYGSISLTPAQTNQSVSMTLNSAAQAGIAAAAGSTLAFGGILSTLDGPTSTEFVFGSSLGAPGDVQLTLIMAPDTTPTLQPGSLQYLANGNFQFTLSGATGSNYEIQVSTDLKTWTALETVLNASGTVTITDTNKAPRRFYRALLAP